MGFVTSIISAIALTVLTAFAASAADDPVIEELLRELQEADEVEVARIENQIWAEWSKSGSAAMDLLLKRGREAIDMGDYETAINHLTALTDHAPNFAEGFNARATAYFYASRYGEAISDIATTLTLNPRHFGAMTGLAMIYEAMDNPRAALQVLREVEKLNPHQTGLSEHIAILKKYAGEDDI